MTTHVTKTWFEDGKLITQFFEEKDIYKREWVGLTVDEILSALEAVDPEAKRLPRGFAKFAYAIEAKLKEKNNA